MIEWLDLPVEVRLIIFGFLAADPGGNPRKPASKNRKSGLACYSTISKEWQLFFEPELYRRLTLSQDSLHGFDELVSRQRSLVQHIWLRFELATYTCSRCLRPVCGPPEQREMKGLSSAISKVFNVLNRWDSSLERHRGGIKLEISVYSPSDTRHSFRGDKYLDADSNEMQDMKPNESPISDFLHGWVNGHPREPPSVGDIYERWLRLGLWQIYEPPIYPVVRVVTNLVFRRTTRRYIAAEVFEAMLQSLPNLCRFTYETWRQLIRFGEYLWESKHRQVITNHLPASLRTLILFEDFNEDINRLHFENRTGDHPHPHPLWSPELIRTPSRFTSSTLAYKSIWLENLAGSYSIDAVPFFSAIGNFWAWQNLKRLSLTCQLLLSHINYAAIIQLLVTVGNILLRMPKLQLLDIWHGVRYRACAFKHRVISNRITINWCGTWELALMAEESIMNIWQLLMRAHSRANFSVEMYQWLDSQIITSHAAAIRLLGISELVIHSASLEEISGESRFYFS